MNGNIAQRVLKQAGDLQTQKYLEYTKKGGNSKPFITDGGLLRTYMIVVCIQNGSSQLKQALSLVDKSGCFSVAISIEQLPINEQRCVIKRILDVEYKRVKYVSLTCIYQEEHDIFLDIMKKSNQKRKK